MVEGELRQLVLLGDSLFAGGEWSQWLPQWWVINAGVPGDTSAGLLARFSADLDAQAHVVSILIGTNDLTARIPRDEVAHNVELLIARVEAKAPRAQVLVQSVPPRTSRLRGKLRGLNLDLERIAAGRGATYLDLWPALADDSGRLRRELTPDDLHLNGAGYQAWVSALRPVLSKWERAVDQER